MNTLVVAPVQWSSLKDIDDVEPVGVGDTICMSEVRDVLKKHGMLQRFGLALLHSHFPVSEDEIMLETNDDETRTSTTKPVRLAEAGTGNVGTIYVLRDGDMTTMSWCKTYCRRGGGLFFGHSREHRVVRD